VICQYPGLGLFVVISAFNNEAVDV